MHPVAVIDFIFFLGSLAALLALLRGWNRTFDNGTNFLYAGLLVSTLFYSFCLLVEWAGITNALDTIEDYIGAVLPMWWAFIFYGFMQESASSDLRESEKRLNLALEGTNDGLWDLYPQSGKVYFNPRWFTMLGYEPDEFPQSYESWKNLLNPEDLSKAEEIVTRFLGNKEESYISEFRMRTKDGHWRWINARGKAVEWDEAGGITRMIGTHTDITGRKEAEEALRKSEEKYRTLFKNASEAIYVAQDGMIKFQNPQTQELFGYPEQELTAKPFTQFIHPEDQASVYERHKKRSGGKLPPSTHFFRIINKTGDIKWVEINVAGFTWDDRPASLCFLKDITERKQAEAALRENEENLENLVKQRTAELQIAKEEAETANQAKSEFVARMSHEIRTPMNAILGMTELLSETEVSPEQNDYLKTLRSSGEFLLSTINDILDFSKIEANQIELEQIPFDVCDLVEETGKAMAVRAREKGLELAFRVAPEVSHYRVGDPIRLRQVLFNLLGNAIKFTPQGEIELEVIQGPDPEDADLLEFRIRDSGIGIAPEKIDSVFDSFSQADTFTTRQYGGTGLGLAICKRLVELMNGRIWIESEHGRGATFIFTTRLMCTDQIPQTSYTAEADLKELKILVVDDNATNRLVAYEYVSRWGAEVNTVESGGTALDLLARSHKDGKPYDLVLLDINMPGMDGLEVAKQIKSLNSTLVPAVMILTSSDSLGDKARSRDLGLDGYLVKPIIRAELLQGILVALGKEDAVEKEIETTVRTDDFVLPSLRLLLAEDIKANRKVINRFLKQTPVIIEMAEDGQQAVEKYVTGRFDIVLMDIQMPVMDGFEATRTIRVWEKENNVPHTPIVALTAHAFEEQRQKCFEAGCTAFLSKPVKKKDLVETLAKLFPVAGSGHEKKSVPGQAALFAKETSGSASPREQKYRAQVDIDLQDLVPDLLTDIDEELINMGKCLQDKDFDNLCRLSHGFKGAAGNYELHDLSKIFRNRSQAIIALSSGFYFSL